MTIGNNVATIGNYAFALCTSLQEVNSLNPIPPKIETINFEDRHRCTLYVPLGSLTSYQGAAVWGGFSPIIEKEFTSVEVIEKNRLHLFVNSTSGNITITGLEGNEILSFYTINGQLLFTQKAFSETEHIAVSHLPCGVYFVNINNGQTLKLIKKHSGD